MHRLIIADVEYPEWGKTAGGIVIIEFSSPTGNFLNHSYYPLDNVINIREVTPHVSVIVYIDGLSFNYSLGKDEKGHVRSAIGTIGIKEAEPRGRKFEQRGVTVRH